MTQIPADGSRPALINAARAGLRPTRPPRGMSPVAKPHRLMTTLIGLLLVGKLVHAEPLPRDERERACWLQHTRQRTAVSLTEPTLVDFSNLADGYTVRSPFRVDFGIRGMGVMPAGPTAHAHTGHHHLLIDTPLPLDISAAIPFNDHYRHFGKGQTGTVLDLPPGPHTLRLLFADHAHHPYFVYSPEIRVTVSGPRSAAPVDIAAGCQAWYQDQLTQPPLPGQRAEISNLRDGEPLTSPFSVRLTADGYGIAPRNLGSAATGYFLLEVQSEGKPLQTVDLASGATQANLFLRPGRYALRLHLLDNAGKRDLVPVTETAVTVTRQDPS